MQIRCPHCHSPIELVDEDVASDVTCGSCGSGFNLAKDGETVADDGSSARMLAHFQMIQPLGQGAFGSVWKARDTELDRIVALKIPRKDGLSQEEAEQFLREARAAAQLRHANIVPVHEVGRDDGTLYIVSDFVEGLSLADWLTGQQLTSREAVELTVTIADALQHAHDAGVIHRDLKPANIMLDAEGHPHVMDFGLARREAGEITMTVEGRLLGTPAYMPPEQARGDGHHADRRSDLYSLGVILFELLTGEKPFRGNVRMLVHQVIHDEPPRLRSLNQSVPRDLETITLKCLQKDPDSRYQSTSQLQADLNRWLRGEPIHARPVSKLERAWRWCRRRPAFAAVWALAVLLFSTVAVGSFLFAVQQTDFADKQKTLRENAEHNAVMADRAAYCADMQMIQYAWDSGRIDVIRDRLDKYRDRDDLTGFEFGYWDRLAHQERQIIRGHEAAVMDVAFSPDDTRIASASLDGTVRIWDALTGREVFTLSGDPEGVECLAYSPDGRVLVTGGDENSIILWDCETGKKTLTLDGHQKSIVGLAFSPDGKTLASGSWDRTVRIWDIGTGSSVATLDAGLVRAIAFSPDGSIVASAGGALNLWDVKTGELINTLTEFDGDLTCVVISPNSQRLAAAGYDHKVHLWNCSSGEHVLSLPSDHEAIHDLDFSPDGNRLAAVSGDDHSLAPEDAAQSGINAVRIWDLSLQRVVLKALGHSDDANCVAFSHDGSLLASGGTHAAIRIWPVEPAVFRREGGDHVEERPRILSSTRGSETLSDVAYKVRDDAQVWDARTGQKLLFLDQDDKYSFRAVSSDGSVMATWLPKDRMSQESFVSPDDARQVEYEDTKTIRIFDLTTEKKTCNLKRVSDQEIRSHAFSPSADRLAYTFRADAGEDADETLIVWDLKAGSLLSQTRYARSTFLGFDLVFSPDGERLAAFDKYGHGIRILDASTGKQLVELKKAASGYVTALTFCRASNLVCAGFRFGTVAVWDSETGQVVFETTDQTHDIDAVAVSPDGSRIASGDTGGSIFVWDLLTGQRVLVIQQEFNERFSNLAAMTTNVVNFSRDGTLLYQTLLDGSPMCFDSRPWTPQLLSESRARGVLVHLRKKAKTLEDLRRMISSHRAINETTREIALEWLELFWENRVSDPKLRPPAAPPAPEIDARA